MRTKQATSLRPNGHVTIDDPGGTKEWDTLQCVHCGMHWRVVPGSGKVRGWCTSCSGPICGAKCQVCYPLEKQLDDAEKGIILP